MIDYVLVSDVTDNGNLYYYAGYFNHNLPVNTNDYIFAMKTSYENEAEILCDKINALKKNPFKYHVEEHMYVNLR